MPSLDVVPSGPGVQVDEGLPSSSRNSYGSQEERRALEYQGRVELECTSNLWMESRRRRPKRAGGDARRRIVQGRAKTRGWGAPSFPHLHSRPLPHSALLRLLPSPLFPLPPPRIFARPVSFERIDYEHVPLPGFKFGREVPLIGSLPRGWDTWDPASLCKVGAAVSFWECASLPGTPTEVSPRTGGDDWVGQKQLWARRRHCEILVPDRRSGPDHYCNTSRGSTA